MQEIELDAEEWGRIGGPLDAAVEPALLALASTLHGASATRRWAREVGIDHLPLAALVAVRTEARRRQDAAIGELLGVDPAPSPFVVGLSGGVAVGKSMAAEALAALLRAQFGLTATVITTDGFLLPNAELEARGLVARKGFPESYDQAALLALLDGVRRGRTDLVAPVYDHLASDVLPGPGVAIGRPDVLVLEGVNVLQPAPDPTSPAVTEHLHLSVYVDAPEALMHTWFTTRLLDLRSRPAGEVPSHFASTATIPDDQFVELSDLVWEHVNLPNLVQHIAPTRRLADVVLEKGDDHRVRRVLIRR